MKAKILNAFLLSAFSVLALGCSRQELESPENSLHLYQTVEDAEPMSVRAYISEVKSVLDDSGANVNWSEGDRIGVMTEGEVYCYTLKEGAGTTCGIFEGTPVEGEIIGAYYPYQEGQTYDKKSAAEDDVCLDCVLPETQDLKTTPDNMSGCDFKVATSVEKDSDGIYSLTFLQKNSLLDFQIVPVDWMVSEGDVLRSVSVKAVSIISGKFLMDVEMPLRAAIPDNSTGLLVTGNVGEEGIALTGSSPAKVRMCVLSSIKKGDALEINITTDKSLVTCYMHASRDYEEGYRYTMPLDIPSLLSSGKAVIVRSDPFLASVTPGVYDLSNPSSPVPVFALGGNWQCGYVDSYFRLHNIVEAKMLELNYSKQLVAGETVEVTQTSYGDTGQNNGVLTLTVLGVTGDKCWLLDDQGHKGYIIMK